MAAAPRLRARPPTRDFQVTPPDQLPPEAGLRRADLGRNHEPPWAGVLADEWVSLPGARPRKPRLGDWAPAWVQQGGRDAHKGPRGAVEAQRWAGQPTVQASEVSDRGVMDTPEGHWRSLQGCFLRQETHSCFNAKQQANAGAKPAPRPVSP